VMLNLEHYSPGPVTDDQLAFEDRWILSRLTSVTQQVSEALEQYRYSEAARALYDFFWDEFCSAYIEMIKGRFQDAAQRPVAQRVAAYTLDIILRLLHPMIPFITEEIWQLLGTVAPARGLDAVAAPSPSLIVADWPVAESRRIDAPIEEQFLHFNAVLSALREIRSRQNIAPRQPISFCVQCDRQVARMLQPLSAHFAALAQATATAMGGDVKPPRTNATVHLANMDVFMDLTGLIDVEAEISRLEKQRDRITGMIAGKERKLANQSFVERAPADVVQKERDSLVQLRQQLDTVQVSLASLHATS